MEAAFTTVARTQHLPVGGRALVSFGAREVALFNVEGVVYAVDNCCPHRGGPLSEGDLEGSLVYCPLHAWNFDLRTGVSPTYPAAKVQTFPVRILGDEIQLAAP
jgi:nitrite reductase (NADH) small subunit